MPTWFALAFASLPLQLAQRALDPALARSLALVVSDGSVQRAAVLACNGAARAAGVQPGMRLAAARALAQELTVVVHEPAREQAALQELAGWAYQFSAQVALFPAAEGGGLLLETGASERLFGGAQALHPRILGELQRLGYRACDARAAAPATARLLARARAAGLAAGVGEAPLPAEPAALRTRLAPLPLELLGWEAAVAATLHTLGQHSLGDLWALPRGAFARRFGAQRLHELDRLLGAVADPQPLFVPPQRFCARLELPADLAEVEGLLRPLEQLLRLLEGFLRGQGAGATALRLRARHNPRRAQPRPPTTVELALALPEREPRRLLALFRERLARASLPEAAVALELELERQAPWVAVNASWLPPAPQSADAGIDTLQLVQTLHARLGAQRVFRLQAVADHRPERAYRRLALGPEPAPPSGPDPSGASVAAPGAAPPPAPRPLWILPVPRALPARDGATQLPQYGGPLALLAGPERIEAGWWDWGLAPEQARVHRDYFVARNGQGQTLWIYRELAVPHRWFLHGYFA
jgi:protein ImuB